MSHRPPYSSVHTHADVILEIIILDLPGISKENSETYRWADAHCLSFLPFFLSSLPLAPVTKTYKMVIIIKFNDFNQRISASLNWGHPIHHSFALFWVLPCWEIRITFHLIVCACFYVFSDIAQINEIHWYIVCLDVLHNTSERTLPKPFSVIILVPSYGAVQGIMPSTEFSLAVVVEAGNRKAQYFAIDWIKTKASHFSLYSDWPLPFTDRSALPRYLHQVFLFLA